MPRFLDPDDLDNIFLDDEEGEGTESQVPGSSTTAKERDARRKAEAELYGPDDPTGIEYFQKQADKQDALQEQGGERQKSWKKRNQQRASDDYDPADIPADLRFPDRIGMAFPMFLMTGLPITKTSKNYYVRQNSNFLMRLERIQPGGEADDRLLLPYGIDRLAFISVATLALRRNTPKVDLHPLADLLDLWGNRKDGIFYKRFSDAIWRLYYTNVFWGENTDYTKVVKGRLQRQVRVLDDNFRFFKSITQWVDDKTGAPAINSLPHVELTPKVWALLYQRGLPVNIDLLKHYIRNPGAFDLVAWICYRAFKIPAGQKSIVVPYHSSPGRPGLDVQLGGGPYHQNDDQRHNFSRCLNRWLAAAQELWPKDFGRFPAKKERFGLRVTTAQLIPNSDKPLWASRKRRQRTGIPEPE